jgi:hypothetical protein
MINDLISGGAPTCPGGQDLQRLGRRFARRSDPNRVFPLAIIPNTDPMEAAAEVRRCAKIGLRGGDPPSSG